MSKSKEFNVNNNDDVTNASTAYLKTEDDDVNSAINLDAMLLDQSES